MPQAIPAEQERQTRLSRVLEWSKSTDITRYERRNWIAVSLVLGIMGFAVGNGHTTQNAVQAIASKEGQERQQVHVLKSTLNALKPAPSKTDSPRHSGTPNQAE